MLVFFRLHHHQVVCFKSPPLRAPPDRLYTVYILLSLIIARITCLTYTTKMTSSATTSARNPFAITLSSANNSNALCCVAL